MDNRIKVIDSPTGTGKTSWAINYINQLPLDQKVIFITPYLDECDRIVLDVKRKMISPDKKLGQGKKRNHFLELVKQEENIVSTHALFEDIDDEIIEELKNTSYILILDETFSVLDNHNLFNEVSNRVSKDVKNGYTRNDVQQLIQRGLITVDESYKVHWADTNQIMHKYDKFKNLCDRGLMYFIRDSLLLWSFPYEVFAPGIFDEIYILTYLFDYQFQKYYYDYHHLEFARFHIERINNEFEIIKTENKKYDIDWRSKAKSLITILDDPKLNKIGNILEYDIKEQPHIPLSATWYIKNKIGCDRLKKNIINYFINIVHSKSTDRLWTCYEDQKKEGFFKDKNLSVRSWMAVNTRATNDFRTKSTLAYPINVYLNPLYNGYFQTRNIFVDEDAWATSEMIQWIWRSQIRDSKPISIYIPSSRMRQLLTDFLDYKICN